MKTPRNSPAKRGFTLMELMVAMAITTIIVTVLVSITSIALETWNRSRSELRAARMGKKMIDSMARDFESLVIRRGNTNEWLSAIIDPELSSKGEAGMLSTNASKLVFFTAATDRYKGELAGKDQIMGNTDDPPGGDVSCVAYQLDYKDPISTTGSSKFKTFVLSRLLVNPDDAFTNLLGATDATKSLDSVFSGIYPSGMVSDPDNFICENIYQFTITFNVQVTKTTTAPSPVTTVANVAVTLGKTNSGQTTDSFKIKGSGIETNYAGSTSVTAAELKAGRVTSMQVSTTVISDFGIDQMKRRSFNDDAAKAKFLAQNSYQYTKLVQLPSM